MPLRVLALCGFTQNAHIYSRQLGAIRKTCKEVDFVFLEPPHVVEKVDMPWTQNLNDFDSSATTDKEEQTAETTPRAWTFASEDRSVYRKFDETVQYLHDFLVKEPPFDGVLGFSQGACMAAILAALLEAPRLHPLFPPNPPLPKFKFLISVGGFLPAPKNLQDWFPLPSSLPTLHIIGRNDIIVTAERSQTLIDKCESARVEYHEGGHFTPSKASWRHFFNAYITSFAPGGTQGDVPSPSGSGPSGTSTPIDAKASVETSQPASPSTRAKSHI